MRAGPATLGLLLNGRFKIITGQTLPPSLSDRLLGSPTFAVHQRMSLTSLMRAIADEATNLLSGYAEASESRGGRKAHMDERNRFERSIQRAAILSRSAALKLDGTPRAGFSL